MSPHSPARWLGWLWYLPSDSALTQARVMAAQPRSTALQWGQADVDGALKCKSTGERL